MNNKDFVCIVPFEKVGKFLETYDSKPVWHNRNQRGGISSRINRRFRRSLSFRGRNTGHRRRFQREYGDPADSHRRYETGNYEGGQQRSSSRHESSGKEANKCANSNECSSQNKASGEEDGRSPKSGERIQEGRRNSRRTRPSSESGGDLKHLRRNVELPDKDSHKQVERNVTTTIEEVTSVDHQLEKKREMKLVEL